MTLEPDLAVKAKKGAAKLGKSFKEVINAALRIGLDQVETARGQTLSHQTAPPGTAPGLQL